MPGCSQNVFAAGISRPGSWWGRPPWSWRCLGERNCRRLALACTLVLIRVRPCRSFVVSNKITVVKQDHLGVEVIRYQGKVLMRTADEILIKAFFALEHAMMVDIPLLKGDKFLETYFTGHWYNIYEIHDRVSDHLKGWYCNVSYPAEISQSLV